MANREVNLTKRITTSNGLRYCPVALSNNGRVKQDAVMVNGMVEKHSEGAYYLEFREGGKRIRRSVGTDAEVASDQREKKLAMLNAVNHGITVVTETAETKQSLASAVSAYLHEVELSKKPRSLQSYRLALEYFLESCTKTNVEDIDRLDMLEFAAFLRDEKELGARTVHNKFAAVMIFLKAQGVTKLLTTHDWPNYTEEEVTVYTKSDIEKLRATSDAEDQTFWDFFLMTGMREQEVRYCYWSNVNFERSEITVTHKPNRAWTPKAYKERTIPVPTVLIEELKTLKAAAGDCELVFPTANCNLRKDFLIRLKRIAAKAGVSDAYLHKFRATFATWHLWAGVDLATVREWLGHKDMKSTMRYLKAQSGPAMTNKVNATFA